MKIENGIEFIKRAEKDLPETIIFGEKTYKLFTQSLLSGSLIIRYGEYDEESINWEAEMLDLVYTIVDVIPENTEELNKKVIYKTTVDDIISDCLDKIDQWGKEPIPCVPDVPIVLDAPIKHSDNSKSDDFKTELTNLINRYSIENQSDTPDYMIAEYLIGCLENYNKTLNKREKWYNRK